MSDIEITEATDDQVTPDEGQVSEAVDAEVETPEAEPELFDYTEVGDKFVKLQVDGEEVLVPVKEALAGYQRQADYTRKTQELSEQRRQVQFGAALQEALQNDPKGTLSLLSQHYGVGQQPSDEEELYMDPVEKQYKQLEGRVQAFEQEKARNELERTIQSLQTRYGSDFDANEVVSKALAIGSSDWEGVYKQMAFDKVYEDALTVRQLREKRANEQKQITDSKRQASVASTTSSAGSADVSAQPIKSLRDAFEAAKRQLSV